MIIKLFLPIIVGFSIVLQGTLNRNSAEQTSLVSAVFMNALVFLCFSGFLWLLIKFNFIAATEAFAAKPLTNLQWWQFIPGLLGFLIVFLTPLAINSLGASLTFACIICTQLVVSLIWDAYAQKSFPQLASLAGVGIMIVGLLVLVVSKKTV